MIPRTKPKFCSFCDSRRNCGSWF